MHSVVIRANTIFHHKNMFWILIKKAWAFKEYPQNKLFCGDIRKIFFGRKSGAKPNILELSTYSDLSKYFPV